MKANKMFLVVLMGLSCRSLDIGSLICALLDFPSKHPFKRRLLSITQAHKVRLVMVIS